MDNKDTIGKYTFFQPILKEICPKTFEQTVPSRIECERTRNMASSSKENVIPFLLFFISIEDETCPPQVIYLRVTVSDFLFSTGDISCSFTFYSESSFASNALGQISFNIG